MKLSLDYSVSVNEHEVSSQDLLRDLDAHRDGLSDLSAVQGRLLFWFGKRDSHPPFREPLVRFVSHWLSKIAWVLGGDTEIIALVNSEECFAFVPTGDAVELSFYRGMEDEVDEYTISPVVVRLKNFVDESLKIGDGLVQLIRQIDAAALEENDDCVALVRAVQEAREAWKDHASGAQW